MTSVLDTADYFYLPRYVPILGNPVPCFFACGRPAYCRLTADGNIVDLCSEHYSELALMPNSPISDVMTAEHFAELCKIRKQLRWQR